LAAAGLEAAIAEPYVMSAELVNGTMRVDRFPAAKSLDLRRLIDESPIVEIVGRASQSPVTFYMDQMFHKPPGLVAPTNLSRPVIIRVGQRRRFCAWS
jgi:hypothetical protein